MAFRSLFSLLIRTEWSEGLLFSLESIQVLRYVCLKCLDYLVRDFNIVISIFLSSLPSVLRDEKRKSYLIMIII